MGNKKNKEALLAEGITETLNFEKCFRIQQEVGIALSKIIDEWKPRLRSAKANGDESVADEYLEAIATEIIDNSNVNEKKE